MVLQQFSNNQSISVACCWQDISPLPPKFFLPILHSLCKQTWIQQNWPSHTITKTYIAAQESIKLNQSRQSINQWALTRITFYTSFIVTETSAKLIRIITTKKHKNRKVFSWRWKSQQMTVKRHCRHCIPDSNSDNREGAATTYQWLTVWKTMQVDSRSHCASI